MNTTFREKMISSSLKKAKKHPMWKRPILVSLTLVLFFYYLARHFAENGKRYVAIGFALVFFVLSSSFSFPIVAEKTGFVSADGENQATLPQSVQQMPEAEKSGAVLNSSPANSEEYRIDDEDVEDGYDYAQANGIDDSDQYTLEDILNENTEYVMPQGGKEKEEQRSKTVFDASDWRLILINKQHPIPEDYQFELMTIKGNMQCDSRIIDELLTMMQAAKNDGVNLVIRSPYRDMSRQEYLFDKKINKYMGGGMSYMEAYKTASQTVTVPGASEHQIGLAIDITSEEYVALDAGFGDTQAGKWLQEHSWEYGFVLRYPLGKEYITSIEYEPWHFRYTGRDAATVMKKSEITLEEFVEKFL